MRTLVLCVLGGYALVLTLCQIALTLVLDPRDRKRHS